jgi:hypothetical protein
VAHLQPACGREKGGIPDLEKGLAQQHGQFNFTLNQNIGALTIPVRPECLPEYWSDQLKEILGL